MKDENEFFKSVHRRKHGVSSGKYGVDFKKKETRSANSEFLFGDLQLTKIMIDS